VTPFLVATGIVVALGAAVAIGARAGRASSLGILVALAFGPFLADPLPSIDVAAFRIAAGVLAAFLVLVAARRAGPAASSPLGLPATLAAAAAAFVVGLGATAVGLPAFGPAAAVAAGLASLAVAVPPIGLARDPLRLGVASIVLLNAGLLLRAGLAGTPSGLESLVAGSALVALAAVVVVLGGSAATAAGDAVDAPRTAARPATLGTAARPSTGNATARPSSQGADEPAPVRRPFAPGASEPAPVRRP
jgi:hypothetical protein